MEGALSEFRSRSQRASPEVLKPSVGAINADEQEYTGHIDWRLVTLLSVEPQNCAKIRRMRAGGVYRTGSGCRFGP